MPDGGEALGTVSTDTMVETVSDTLRRSGGSSGDGCMTCSGCNSEAVAVEVDKIPKQDILNTIFRRRQASSVWSMKANSVRNISTAVDIGVRKQYSEVS